MESKPAFKLYGIWQMTVAALLGSPLPGFWMASQNLRRLGRIKEAKRSMVWGVGLTGANIAIAFTLPDSAPRSSIAIPFVIGTKMMIERWLKPALDEHRAAGGSFASWWVAVGCGIASLIAILALVFGVLVLLETMK